MKHVSAILTLSLTLLIVAPATAQGTVSFTVLENATVSHTFGASKVCQGEYGKTTSGMTEYVDEVKELNNFTDRDLRTLMPGSTIKLPSCAQLVAPLEPIAFFAQAHAAAPQWLKSALEIPQGLYEQTQQSRTDRASRDTLREQLEVWQRKSKDLQAAFSDTLRAANKMKEKLSHTIDSLKALLSAQNGVRQRSASTDSEGSWKFNHLAYLLSAIIAAILLFILLDRRRIRWKDRDLNRRSKEITERENSLNDREKWFEAKKERLKSQEEQTKDRNTHTTKEGFSPTPGSHQE